MFPFKKFIRKGEKYIVVEGEKPEYVIMRYDDYAELIAWEKEAPRPKGPAASTVLDEGEFNAEAVLAGPELPEDLSKIRLEDLPL